MIELLPPVFPKLFVPDLKPAGMRSPKSGNLKLLLLEAEPYLVPITANNEAYVVLLISLPSHISQPFGALSPEKLTIIPQGLMSFL